MPADKEILEKIASGDETAFSDVFKRYYKDLCRFIFFHFSNDKAETEEIVQNIMLKLWENRKEIHKIESLKAYLYRSARNACINLLEHKAVKQKYADKAGLELKKMELEIEDNIEDNHEEIIRELENFPEQTRNVFNLKYIEGLKYKQIAVKLGISEKTVETLIYRGLKQLRKKFIDDR